MGLPKIIVKVLMEIGVANGYELETREQKEEFLDNAKPKQAKGGFLRVGAVICCECGIPIPIDASPSEMTEKEFDEASEMLKDDPDSEVIKMKPPGAIPTGKASIATNVGVTHIECPECKRQYVTAWEFDACEVSGDLKLPWDSQESPEDSSSELDFSRGQLDNGSVH